MTSKQINMCTAATFMLVIVLVPYSCGKTREKHELMDREKEAECYRKAAKVKSEAVYINHQCFIKGFNH